MTISAGSTTKGIRPHLYQLSWVKTAKPADSCRPKNDKAWNCVISPLANGLFLVRAERNRKGISITGLPTTLKDGRTYGLVNLRIPHIVDGTSCAAHDDGSRAEQGEVEERSR
jgi:hypothetical protein